MPDDGHAPPARNVASISVISRMKKKANQAATRVRTKREAQGKTPEGRAADEESSVKSLGPTPVNTTAAKHSTNLLVGSQDKQTSAPKGKAARAKNSRMKALISQVRSFLGAGKKKDKARPVNSISSLPLSTKIEETTGHPGTPRYESSSHSGLASASTAAQPGTPRYGQSPAAAEGLGATGSSASHVATPRYNAQKGALAALPGPAATAAVSKDDVVDAVGVEEVTLSLEVAELSEEQTSAVDAQIERDRAYLASMVTMEAAKWQLVREMGAPEAASASLASSLKSALDNLPLGQIPHELGEPSVAAGLGVRMQRLGAVRDELGADPESVVDEEQRQLLVAKVTDAKLVVIDPNMEALTNHLRGMLDEHLGAAAAELSSARLRLVVQAKAKHVHSIIVAAMDDVESQFCGGMGQVIQKLMPKLPEDQIQGVCAAAVRAHRLQMGQEYTLDVLERKMRELLREASKGQKSAATRQLASLATNPHEWLWGIVLGSTGLDLEADVLTLLSSTIAAYLDPFIDGEVPASEYAARSSGLLAERWQRACTEHRGAVADVPPDYILAEYVRHAITKMNTNLGFDVHQPGIGRQPLSDPALDQHAKARCLCPRAAAAAPF